MIPVHRRRRSRPPTPQARSFLLFFAIIVCWPGTALSQISPADAAFNALADEFIDSYYLPEHPSAATRLGVHRYDDRLEDYSRAGIARRIATLKAFESRVAAVDGGKLSTAVAGDRDLLLGSVRSELLDLQTIRAWEKDPDVYSSGITSSAFAIMSRRFAPPEERLNSLIAREEQMLGIFAEARNNLRNPPRIYTEIALEQLPAIVSFFENDVPAAFSDVDDPELKDAFAASNAAVIAALNDYQTWLREELLPKSHGDFRIGAEAYVKKLEYDEMVTTPLDRLLEIGMRDLERNQAEFARIAKEIEPDKTARQVLAELAADYPPPDELLDVFRSSLDGLVQFINEHHIVTIPSTVRPIVEETPPFARAVTFASMDTPGPFEKSATEAYFNVTLPAPDWPEQRVEEFMAQFNYPVINGVAVHEAYPGHYVQFLVMHDVQSRVRRIFGAATNSEGWAHYCEQMMLDEGLAQAMYPDDVRRQKLLRLGQLQDALLRDARYIVGIELHTGQMNFEEAVDFFVDEGYQSRAVGEVETKRGTSDPTYLYYTLGKLEILRLRADVERRQGDDFSLQRFHDAFLHQGAPPIGIVREAMLGDGTPAS